MDATPSRLPMLNRAAISSAKKSVRKSIGIRSGAIVKNKQVAQKAVHSVGRISGATQPLKENRYTKAAIGTTPSSGKPLAVINSRHTPSTLLKRHLPVYSVPRNFREAQELPSSISETQHDELKCKLSALERKYNESVVEAEQLKMKTSMLEAQLKSLSSELITASTQLTMTSTQLTISESKNRATVALYESTLEEAQNFKKECEQMRDEANNNQISHKKELLLCNDRIRLLLNEVVDLRGRIRVAVRLRPFLAEDGPSTSIAHFDFPDLRSVNIKTNNKTSSYQFQNVFGCKASQKKMFSEMEELVESVLHGYNVAIIAYGQTGSGKTYTMRGGEGENAGIIPRAIEFMFQTKDKLSDLDWEYNYSASFLEVYNDEVFDLLADEKTKLKVSVGSGQVEIPNLKSFQLNSPDELHDLLALSDKNRSTASTKMNSTSSRSHAVFFLKVTATNTMTNQSFSSLLSMVDLAGSERAKESEAEGARFTEMTYINKALSNLQNVMRALLKKEQHIPYRNSKLTLLLQECLGKGNSKTLMIVNLRPSAAHSSESKRSLDFAQNTSKTIIGAALKSESA